MIYSILITGKMSSKLQSTKYIWNKLFLNWRLPELMDGITHLEPDILECEVKWALESIIMNKATGGDGIPVELFQILKDDAVNVLHSICQQIWKTQQWPQDWTRSVFIPIPKKGSAKECWNYCTIALISHASKVKVKSLSHVWLFATPWTVACTRLLCPWDFLGKSTGVGCHFLLQEIFLTQGLNLGLCIVGKLFTIWATN